MKQKKRKGRSVQQLLGIQTFTKYGLMTDNGELLFYRVAPTNISVLSAANIEIKIRHLQMVLSAIPDIEIICTDSCECFDDNKAYLYRRAMEENNPDVRGLLLKDREMLTSMQAEMLRIVPAKWEDKWYQWNQELPANASPEARQQAKEFSELKLGYRGDLRFSQVEVFEMTEVMGIAPTQEQDTTFPNLTM